MIKIGNYNTLRVARFVDFGAYLTDDDNNEVLLPARYVPDDATVGDEIEVFVYTDSEDRPVAVTEHPFATVGEFAFLQVAQVNKFGAFLDWGVPKHLLVPFSEQRLRMEEGGIYPVYVYLDDITKRVVASGKLEKFLGNVIPDYKPGQEVQALVWKRTDIGYKVIVDNLFQGMIYDNEVYAPLEIQQAITAYVKNVRDDGKIDLTVGDRAAKRVSDLTSLILDRIEHNGGRLTITDSSSPEEIKRAFHCSKKDFKKAVGKLYKERKIAIGEDCITLV
ncbi:MAG: GntR family transcriptional regulator [Muribaculaceae bacterium]|nr:GntR family transcriptional regulator [Muribaculaceae bacterium]